MAVKQLDGSYIVLGSEACTYCVHGVRETRDAAKLTAELRRVARDIETAASSTAPIVGHGTIEMLA